MNTKHLISAVAVSLMLAGVVQAHAFLDHAEPKVGSAIHEAPSQLTVWMTEGLEAVFSKLQVFDAQGAEVDKKDTKVNGSTMTVSLPKLAPGKYRVSWHVVAVDTHRTSGTFEFTIE
jgi:copper resistance protein C